MYTLAIILIFFDFVLDLLPVSRGIWILLKYRHPLSKLGILTLLRGIVGLAISAGFFYLLQMALVEPVYLIVILTVLRFGGQLMAQRIEQRFGSIA